MNIFSRLLFSVGVLVLHEHKLHEGAPAKHAAPGLRAQVTVKKQVRRLGGGA